MVTGGRCQGRNNSILRFVRGLKYRRQSKTGWKNGLIKNPLSIGFALAGALGIVRGALAPRLSPAEVYVSNLSSKIGVDCLCYSDSIPLARFGKRVQQSLKSNPGNGFTSRRLITPSVRFGPKPQFSSNKMIGVSV